MVLTLNGDPQGFHGLRSTLHMKVPPGLDEPNLKIAGLPRRTCLGPLRPVVSGGPPTRAPASSFALSTLPTTSTGTVPTVVTPAESVAVAVMVWLPGLEKEWVASFPVPLPPSPKFQVTTTASPRSGSDTVAVKVRTSSVFTVATAGATESDGGRRPYSSAPMSRRPFTARGRPSMSVG